MLSMLAENVRTRERRRIGKQINMGAFFGKPAVQTAGIGRQFQGAGDGLSDTDAFQNTEEIEFPLSARFGGFRIIQYHHFPLAFQACGEGPAAERIRQEAAMPTGSARQNNACE